MNAAVAAEIRAQMARKRLKVGDLAGVLGLSEKTVSLMLHGRRVLTLNEVEVIAEHLQIDPFDFIETASASAPTAGRVA